MRMLIVLALAVFAVASARPNRGESYRALAEKLMKKFAAPRERGLKSKAVLKSRTFESAECETPCQDTEGVDAFLECAAYSAFEIEMGFNDLYVDLTGEDLLTDEEYGLLWIVRGSSAGLDIKAGVEEGFSEAAEYRFEMAYEAADPGSVDHGALSDLVCQYESLKEAVYDFFSDDIDKK